MNTVVTSPSFDDLFINNVPLMDVRAPCEYQRGAFPASVNIPILNDTERELVGTCYKQQGQQQAIALGHKLLTPQKRKPLIALWKAFAETNPQAVLYCFRGGKRSKISQQWLKEHHVNLPIIAGGYKALRTHLLEILENYSAALPLVLLSGKTGSGKTLLLPKLPHHIDLEGLANHRGSSFGAVLTPQPTNINFENQLAVDMLKVSQGNPSRVFIEDEGTLIGRISIPETLRTRMLTLPAVLLTASIEERVKVSEKDYIRDLLKNYQSQHGTQAGLGLFIEHHKRALNKIQKRFGADNIKQCISMFDTGITQFEKDSTTTGFHPYIEHLLTRYYDPMYEYQFNSKNRQVVFSGSAEEVIQWSREQHSTG